ncbi:unnamed protein product [Calicophoron daubneyi]
MGLLQTMFFVSYTALSPIAGYFGDRWRRKYIIMAGLVLWVAVTLASSFIPGNLFYLFLFTRCLVGVGEASYSTIAPTILTDLFAGSARTNVLGLFYFAVPVGSGLGYVVGSAVTDLAGGRWQWSLRVTPALGLLCIILLGLLHKDPPRGLAEGVSHELRTTPWLVDLKYLFCNPTFMLISGGFTGACFILGSMTWFAVNLIQLGLSAKYDNPFAWQMYNVPFIFGVCVCVAGIVGVITGVSVARRLRPRIPKVDPLICAAGAYICVPFLFFALVTSSVNFYLCLVLVFIAEIALCLNWALVPDVTMGAVIPSRRSTAFAVQMIITHGLGDCISPTIIGAISVAISDSKSLEMQYLSLQRALFLNLFVSILSGFLFSMASLYVVQSKEAVRRAIQEAELVDGTYESGYEVTLPSADHRA